MIKLQNNFTTPEQSTRLLELGVPAWTADFYEFKNDGIINTEAGILGICDIPLDLDNAIYCWSVGRLIEIMKICSDLDTVLGYQIAYNTKHKTSLLHIVIQIIEDCINEFDFSKLEE